MDGEVAVLPQPPPPAAEFNFDSGCSTPYISAPSSPQRFGTFFSAPTSPHLTSTIFRELDHLSLLVAVAGDAVSASSSSYSASAAEQLDRLKSDNRRSFVDDGDGDGEFEFSFSGPLQRASLSADELFDGGKIKPLAIPGIRQSHGSEPWKHKRHKDRTARETARFEETDRGKEQEQSSCRGGGRESTSDLEPPRSIKQDSRSLSDVGGSNGRSSAADSNHSMRIFDQSFDRRCRGAGDEQSRHRGGVKESKPNDSSLSSPVRRRSTSATNVRISDILSGPDENSASSSPSPSSSSSSVSLAVAAAKGLRKWLFRSKSEGHEPSEEAQRDNKFAVASRRSEEAKGASFRSTAATERGGGGSVSMSRRRGTVSAHELHYKANRAVSEEMRRRTLLPYKRGLLGCLGFNPGVREISKGFGSMTRG